MTPEEKSYEEALRRIREAEETGALELDLSGKKWEADAWKSTGLETLTRLPPELKRLASLQKLDLHGCKQLTDLSQLASLSSLQELNIFGCRQLTDLSPMASLTSLQTLAVAVIKQLNDLSPLAGLTSLQTLDLKLCSQQMTHTAEAAVQDRLLAQVSEAAFDHVPPRLTGGCKMHFVPASA